MAKPTDHLVRTASMEAGMLALSALSGLSRLSIELHRLAATEQLPIPAGAERFLYVLEGSGSLRVQPQTDESTAEIETGDFVALTPAEVAELHTEQGIAILLGEARGLLQDRPAHSA